MALSSTPRHISAYFRDSALLENTDRPLLTKKKKFFRDQLFKEMFAQGFGD